MLCIDGYMMPVVWHVISPVLFKILQYLQRGLLQKLNLCSLVEFPWGWILEMVGLQIFSVEPFVSFPFLVRNWSTFSCLFPWVVGSGVLSTGSVAVGVLWFGFVFSSPAFFDFFLNAASPIYTTHVSDYNMRIHWQFIMMLPYLLPDRCGFFHAWCGSSGFGCVNLFIPLY